MPTPGNTGTCKCYTFISTTDHSNVPCSPTTYLLAQWAHCQRNSSFQTHRQRKLLWSINFLWDPQQADFEIQYQRLLDLQQHPPQSIGSVRQWKKMQTAARCSHTTHTTQTSAPNTTNTAAAAAAATTTTSTTSSTNMVLTEEAIWQLELPILVPPVYHEHRQHQQCQNSGLFGQRRTTRTKRT